MNIATIQDSVDYLASIAFSDEYGGITNDILNLCDTAGCSRRVWLYDGVAFKFEYLRNDNQNEYDLYHDDRVNDRVRELMAEPYAISECGRVLAMELMDVTLRERWHRDFGGPDNYETFGTEVDAKRNAFNDDLRTRLQDSGFSHTQACNLTSDNHPSNLAVNFDGEIRWIDYAVTAGYTG